MRQRHDNGRFLKTATTILQIGSIMVLFFHDRIFGR